MTDKVTHFANALKELEVVHHKDVSEGAKKTSLIESHIDKGIIPLLLKMKHGPLTHIKLAVDGSDDTECIMQFRLLTAQEESEIDNELDKLKYVKGLQLNWDIYNASKVLSRATKKGPSDMNWSQPEVSEEDFRKGLTLPMLLALGRKYGEFAQKMSPRFETLNKNKINEIISELDECGSDPEKKLIILRRLNLNATYDLILDLLNTLATFTKQMDNCITGT